MTFSPLAFLVLSLAALMIGPVLFRLGQRRGWALALLDGFTFSAIGGLVVFVTIPEAFHHAGWSALAIAVVGFFGPTFFERWLKYGAAHAHMIAILVGLAGLIAHSVMDGAAIAANNPALALAVVLHQLPVGLTICLLLAPRGKWRLALLVIALMCVATAAGFSFGELLPEEGSFQLGLFEGLVSGALLHVVIHRHSTGSQPVAAQNLWATVGALCGVAVLYAMTAVGGHSHGAAPHAHSCATDVFVELALTSAPALLLGYLGAGLLEVFLPRATLRWLREGSRFGQAVRGVTFGLPLPLCSCGVVPLYRGLVLNGAPMAAAMAFLIATPEIGVDAFLLSLPLLGIKLSLIRLATAALVALFVGWLVATIFRARPTRPLAQIPSAQTSGTRWARVVRAGFVEMVDSTGPWILLGLGVAAVGSSALHGAWLTALHGWDVPLLAVLGIPLYVCASGATPFVAMLIAKGVSPGAAIAFLLTGPATNATTFGILARLHDKTVALVFAGVMTAAAIATGALVNALAPAVEITAAITAHGDHDTSPLHIATLMLLALIFLGSLLRQGPRGFVAHVLSQATSDAPGGPSQPSDPHAHACCAHESPAQTQA